MTCKEKGSEARVPAQLFGHSFDPVVGVLREQEHRVEVAVTDVTVDRT